MPISAETLNSSNAIVSLNEAAIIHILRARPWCAVVRAANREGDSMRPLAAFTIQRSSLEDSTHEPYSWACDNIPIVLNALAASERPKARWSEDSLRVPLDAITRAVRANSQLRAFSEAMPNDDIYAKSIASALRRVVPSAGSAQAWYQRHYEVRHQMYEKGALVDFHVGSAIWDDDWVFNVACTLRRQDVDPRNALVVLVCADPSEYYSMMPDATKLAWLGATSGDIVHFVWMTDRHGKPAMSVKVAVVAALAEVGIKVNPNSPLLLFITMRDANSDDGTIEVDLEYALPLLGRLDDTTSKQIFEAIVERVRIKTIEGQPAAKIVADLKHELSAMYALRTMQKLYDLLKSIWGKFFSKAS